MTLQQKLDAIKKGFEQKAPPEASALMHRATNDLQRSGIMEKVVNEGQTAPSFILDDSQGQSVSLPKLLTTGPLVMTFFRGHW